MKKLIEKLFSLAAITCFLLYHGFTVDGADPDAVDFIMLLSGENSISQVAKVNADQRDSKTLLFIGGNKEPLLELQKEGDRLKGNISSTDGEYSFSTIRGFDAGMITGEFEFKVSEKGKQKEFMDDRGVFQLLPYSAQKFAELKQTSDDRLYRVDKYESLEEMAKVSPWARKYLRENKQKVEEGNVPLIFFGRVVDQFGVPVPDAKIEINVRVKTLIMWSKNNVKNHFFTTDSKGYFQINGIKGEYLNFRFIRCPGYREKIVNKKFRYTGANVYIPLKDHPVVFTLSKITENATYLIKQGENRPFEIKIASGEDSFYSFIDLSYIWRERIQEDFEQKYEKDFVPLPGRHDFKVNGVYDRDKSEWRVTFAAAGEEGGFILGDSFLDEAPAEGYQKEFTFTQPLKTREWDGEIVPETTDFVLKGKYLYIRSRDPEIYTRMRFKDDYANAEFDTFSIRTETATNPYGERNLEYDDTLPLDIRDICSDVEKYFLENELPPKPDMNKLWEEFKKTHEQVEDPETGELKWEKKK